MYIYKKRQKVKLINHDCLPILILLYIMLYIMLAYSMLFAALPNAVCLHNIYIYIYNIAVFMIICRFFNQRSC